MTIHKIFLIFRNRKHASQSIKNANRALQALSVALTKEMSKQSQSKTM